MCVYVFLACISSLFLYVYIFLFLYISQFVRPCVFLSCVFVCSVSLYFFTSLVRYLCCLFVSYFLLCVDLFSLASLYSFIIGVVV